ncbi:hypothetical protein N9X64_00320 [bacterium]|nr:hypothetical protein [bacterium]
MSVIAGMDLGYGSQVKIVKTNYLVVGTTDGGSQTAQGAANCLEMYNNRLSELHRRKSILHADYIILLNDNAGSAGALIDVDSGIDAKVIAADTSTTNIPVMGPVFEALANEATNTYPDAADTAAELSRGYQILDILGVSVSEFGVNFAAGAAVHDVLGGTGGLIQEMQNTLQLAQQAGPTEVISLTEALTNIYNNLLGGTASLDLGNALFNASYVAKGNASGATATAFGGVGASTIVADTCALISVTTLCAHI